MNIMYESLCRHMFSFPLDKYLGRQLLDMVIFNLIFNFSHFNGCVVVFIVVLVGVALMVNDVGHHFNEGRPSCST